MANTNPPDEAAIKARIQASGGALTFDQARAVLATQEEHDASLDKEEGEESETQTTQEPGPAAQTKGKGKGKA